MDLALALCALLLSAGFGVPQTAPPGPSSPPDALRPTVFSHPDESRFWLSGQINLISQGHPSFRSPYQGEHSLPAASETRSSRVLTLYTGYRLTDRASILFDPEMTGGQGIGGALGLAGYPNLDVVRTPGLGEAPYVGRLMLHYVLPLSADRVEAPRGPLVLAPRVAPRRLEFRVGKFSLVDFFDANAVGSDSHLQFLNWAVCNNAAYDYAADTRGYTVAAMAEYHDGEWAIRVAEALMPKVANGPHLQYDLGRAHAEDVEVERRLSVGGHELTVRLLGYENRADMGNYREAVDQYLAGRTSRPDITDHPLQTRLKYGAGLNAQTAISAGLRAFARAGWNDGRTESFVYTEADRSVSGGFDLTLGAWGRPTDKLGAATAFEGLSPDHRDYLALGGLGFLLGDGRLTYGWESIVEIYYTAQLWHGVFVAADLQHVTNPGYNRDRGPVLIPAVRLHVEF